MVDGVATTHPIAGTRPRGDDDEHDILLAKDLVDDAKENAEHLMLVDLRAQRPGPCLRPGHGRGDRVPPGGAVQPRDAPRVDGDGRLADGRTGIDARPASLAGTLWVPRSRGPCRSSRTFEDTRRGVYGGVVGYVDWRGNTDQAIAIRSAVIKDGTASVQAGAGIVADSVAASEDAECRNKAMAVLRPSPPRRRGGRQGRPGEPSRPAPGARRPAARRRGPVVDRLPDGVARRGRVQRPVGVSARRALTGAEWQPALGAAALGALAAIAAVALVRGLAARAVGAVIALLGVAAVALLISSGGRRRRRAGPYGDHE